MIKKLYVGNIPYQVDKEQLTSIFKSYGSVIYVKFPKDTNSKKHRGYAFIEMASPLEAQEALKKLNQSTLMERNIIVSYAVSDNNQKHNIAKFTGKSNCLFCSDQSILFGFSNNIKGICPKCIDGLKKAVVKYQKIKSHDC